MFSCEICKKNFKYKKNLKYHNEVSNTRCNLNHAVCFTVKADDIKKELNISNNIEQDKISSNAIDSQSSDNETTSIMIAYDALLTKYQLLEQRQQTMAEYVIQSMGKRITNISMYVDALLVLEPLNDIEWWRSSCKNLLYYCGIEQYQVLVPILSNRLNLGGNGENKLWTEFKTIMIVFFEELTTMLESSRKTRIHNKLIANVLSNKTIMMTQSNAGNMVHNNDTSNGKEVSLYPSHVDEYDIDKYEIDEICNGLSPKVSVDAPDNVNESGNGISNKLTIDNIDNFIDSF